MKPRTLVLTGCAALLLGTVSACVHGRQESLVAYQAAPDDRLTLWLALHEGFRGTVRYVGSEGDYSFFRAGHLRSVRWKARTNTLHLPRTFRYGESEPYIVTPAMVP